MVKQHGSKAADKLLKEIANKGFSVGKKTKSGTIKIIPPSGVSGEVYHTHGGENCIHQMKRDFKRMYDVDIG